MLDGALSFSDGWTLVEDQLAPAPASTRSLFAVSNGYVGLRGQHREPVGGGGSGVLLSGCFETRPHAFPEKAFGFPETYQTLLEVTDPSFLAISVDGLAVGADTGTWLEHRRALDLRTGCVTTAGSWCAPGGTRVAVRTRRMASLDDPRLVWSAIEVEPLHGEATVEVVSRMVANTGDRAFPDEPDALSRAWGRVLLPLATLDADGLVGLAHRTALSGRAMACVAAVEAPGCVVRREVTADEALCRHRVAAAPGRPLGLVQRWGFADGTADDAERLLAAASASVQAAQEAHIDDAVAVQRGALDEFWAAAAVDIDGDAEAEGAVRFSAFQVFAATARNPGRAAPAKGLSGQGYQGHHLWDQEVYVGHALTLLAPDVARRLLSFRLDTLEAARARARQLSLAGAQFPWRTIDGREASGLFPAGAAQHHVDAAIAWAVEHHVACTGDDGLLVEGGVELLVETARMWASIGHHAADGAFHIPAVTGPNEYTALVADNLYTNVMAAANLDAAATRLAWLAARHPEVHDALTRSLGLGAEEPASWRRAAAAMHVPYDDELGVHGQDATFLRKPRWDLAATPEDRFPLQDHHHLLALYRHQVVKQADVVLALFLQRHRFTPEQRRRDFEYYEPLTTHDSSLSAPIHAIVAADIGALDRAWHYTCDTLLTDLDCRHGTPSEGVHVAAAAGGWLAIARGFGGFAVHDGAPAFAPRLPSPLRGIRFRARFRGALVEVAVGPGETTYRLLEGATLTLRHDGAPLTLTDAQPAATRSTMSGPRP